MNVSRFRICLMLSGLGVLLQQSLSAEHHKRCDRCVGGSAVPVLIELESQSNSSQVASLQPLVVFAKDNTVANQTFLVVNCPHEAEVRIDDFLTKSTGPSRLFRLSSDQSNLPRRVQISFTTYSSNHRTEHEYTEVAHCQPGKTTTISIKKEDMRSKKTCEADCSKSLDQNDSLSSTTAGAAQTDDLSLQLLGNTSPNTANTIIRLDVVRRLVKSKLDATTKAESDVERHEVSHKNLKTRLGQMEDSYLRKLDEALADWRKVPLLDTKDDSGITKTMIAANDHEREARELEQQCLRLMSQIDEAQNEINLSKCRLENARKDVEHVLGMIDPVLCPKNSEAGANQNQKGCLTPRDCLAITKTSSITERTKNLAAMTSPKYSLMATAKSEAMAKRQAAESLAISNKNDNAPKTVPPKTEPPKTEPPKTEPPKT